MDVKQQVSEIGLGFRIGQRANLHLVIKLQFVLECGDLHLERVALGILLQLLFHRFDGSLKRLRKSVLDLDVGSDQLNELAELAGPLAAVAENQVVNQRPRFSIKHAAFATSVVVRRESIDREKSSQRKQLFVTQGAERTR